ncbi:MAG TPA: HAD family hydrolase [Nitrospirota bacterium]|jgi:HAD superfamily hydrolase (TIGR01549 family)
MHIGSARTNLRGILFDLDGTLYFQPRVQAIMLTRILKEVALTRPWLCQWEVVKVLRAFRKNRENLRAIPAGSGIRGLQYSVVAEELGIMPGRVKEIVELFMYEKPLSALKSISNARTREAIERLKKRNFKIGVFSDYPAEDKLAALGLEYTLFDVVADSTMPEIDALKPNPRGFIYSADKMGLAPSEVLYVGDRVDVDIAGAAGAGMKGALVTWSTMRPFWKPKGDIFMITRDITSLERELTEG